MTGGIEPENRSTTSVTTTSASQPWSGLDALAPSYTHCTTRQLSGFKPSSSKAAKKVKVKREIRREEECDYNHYIMFIKPCVTMYMQML